MANSESYSTRTCVFINYILRQTMNDERQTTNDKRKTINDKLTLHLHKFYSAIVGFSFSCIVDCKVVNIINLVSANNIRICLSFVVYRLCSKFQVLNKIEV